MAVRAGYIGVRAQQFKSRQVMVEACPAPGPGIVTALAALSKTTVVLVVTLVTGETTGGCAFEDVINMAAFTGNVGVTAGELENGQVVIKAGRFPGLGRMADTAVDAKSAIMLVVFLVAANTT